MAELVVFSYHGPGEQRTAEVLAQALPDSWVIIVGRALPTPQKDDVDLLVVGDNFIYVLEEKHWGPTIEVVNGGWRVKGRIRESPVGRNSHLARVVAGVLKSSVRGYSATARHKRLVTSRVVLSHEHLELDTTRYPYEVDQILLLDEAAQALMDLDGQPTDLHDVRDDVIEFLSGLQARKDQPEYLGHFRVVAAGEGVGQARVFQARSDDGDSVLLMAYPMDGWGPGADIRELVKHERLATNRIADIQRSWRAESSFTEDARRWIILPIRPAPSVALRRYAAGGNIPIRGPQGMTDRAKSIVRDAFEALAEVHEQGVIHRGLMPSRVLLGRNDRVLFRDFYLSHASSEESIAIDIADMVDASAPFRAPEAATIVRAATEKSDVYSLALTLLWWINGDIRVTEARDVQALPSQLPPFDPVMEILLGCLASKPSERPTAEDVVARLRANSPDPAGQAASHPSSGSKVDTFMAGGHVGGGRYLLERQLGSGGFAISWLAKDTRTGGARVIKQYTNPDATLAAQQEFDAAARLNHARCARVWDYSPEPPVYLVSDYVSGQSLRDLGDAGTANEEDYRRAALDALEGLAYMHSEGQLHRDVSPTNIIVRDDGRAVLIDFGLTADAERAVSVAGTPPFMAPEVEASGTWTPAADLYSLGASLLRTMLHRFPCGGTGPLQLHKDDVQRLTPEEEETWGPNGAAVLNAIYRLVEPDPAHRPRSAAEFAEYLRTVSAPATAEGTDAINPTVLNLRRLYRGSSMGNAGNRGLDDEFARETYVKTLLDTNLAPRVMAGDLDVVLLTGNPGDGKTSFLATLRNQLLDAGATDIQAPTPGGWRMRLNERTYASVYDASEARDGKSSDDLMHEALDGAGQHTALIAVNDGRLLSFFADYADVYPDCYVAVDHYAKGRPGEHPRIAIVDLKRRSLAPTATDEQGLAGAILDSFTADEMWSSCGNCTAREVCPILSNRNLLQGPGRSPLLELVTVSHLRRKRRATFRDVRSAVAWTITGDRGCDDIHQAVAEGRDLRMADDALAFDLAFDAQNPDYLVSEWALVDPQLLASPRVERAIRDGSFGLDRSRRPGSPNRLLFFDGVGTSPVDRGEVRAYRYLDEFIEALAGHVDTTALRARILSGLSRVLGAYGYTGSALALRDGEGGGWSVLREVPAEDFVVRPIPPVGDFVEQQSDGLRLSHRLGSIVLTLDSYEMVRRAADGEILGDIGAEAIRLELSAFGDLLRRTPGRRVLVVDPAGRADAAIVADGIIRREAVG